MLRLLKTNTKELDDFFSRLSDRNGGASSDIENKVKNIIEDVRVNRDVALIKYTELFDAAIPENFEVSKQEKEEALKNCDRDFLQSIKKCAKNIYNFHKNQLEKSWLKTEENGVITGQRIRGLSKVGIYVPGGTAAYPSSVLMNAIPARIAGVKEIVMVTPPFKDEKSKNNILAAAQVARVDRIFTFGGAQAIAGLAYGTETLPKVDKIVGPGNIFVATAKKLLYGVVDIDMIAGPSEILVIADKSANPKFLAADLLSQAEHDKLASAILLATDESLARDTIAQVEKQAEKLERYDIIKEALKNYFVAIVCNSVDEAIVLANDIAPEHLEICVDNPIPYIGKIDNAGSVFLGHYSPEALGDYYAGPNHVLPTGATARFFSPLSVDSFIKKSSFIYYTREALEQAKNDIVNVANQEGLTAHANSVSIRFDD